MKRLLDVRKKLVVQSFQRFYSYTTNMAYIGSLDSGTSSTRFMIFDKAGALISSHQKEHTQYFPAPGLVEHDCLQIWESVQDTMKNAMTKAQLKASDIKAIGITNQRETTVIWNRHTGIPYHKAIVWNDTRTASICTRYENMEGVTAKIKDITGLPLATYFSATKIIYLLETVPNLPKEIEENNALFGTIDSYLIWKLTSGQNHVTDVTNASRTMLMNLQTLQYDDELLSLFDIPKAILPKIISSSHPTDFGIISSKDIPGMKDVRITGVLGDQQAALFGQGCFEIGDAKCTYGTGAFLLLNTGKKAIRSSHGLITTIGYQLHTAPVASPPIFALEGAVAYCGATIQWLRDNLKIIKDTADSETLAAQVPDNGGVYFIPAFSGLFAPYWRRDARAVIIGLSAFHTSSHIARAALEAAAFQTYELIDAMREDSELEIRMLRVDGGMTKNTLLMQFQSDILNEQLQLPRHAETTALGAALIAGLGANYYSSLEEVLHIAHSESGKLWTPNMSPEKRADLVVQSGFAVIELGTILNEACLE